MGIALYFEEDLGLRDVLRGDGRAGFETNVGIHLCAGAKRLLKGDVEGALVFCCMTKGVKGGVGGVTRETAYG